MGMNVSFRYSTKDNHKPFPIDEETGEQHDWKGCLPRYTDSYDFMAAIYDSDNISLKDCQCRDRHQYMCAGETAFRPTDFIQLRDKTKHLQPVWQDVIDYLEAEPNAYVEYN
jgi:hypothetical protein